MPQPLADDVDSDDVVGLQRISREVVAVIGTWHRHVRAESITNDRSPLGTSTSCHSDVQLDPPIPNPSEPESGEAVRWSVFIQNVGEIPSARRWSTVSRASSTKTGSSSMRQRSSGVENPLPTASVSTRRCHRYVPDADSWDYNPDNSRATVSVEVQAPRVGMEHANPRIGRRQQAPAAALTPGQMYTMSIGVTSIETGPVNYTMTTVPATCSKPSQWSSRPVVGIPRLLHLRGPVGADRCAVVPDDVDVSSVFTRAYASAAVQDDTIADEQRSLRGLLSWAGLLVLILMACSCSG